MLSPPRTGRHLHATFQYTRDIGTRESTEYFWQVRMREPINSPRIGKQTSHTSVLRIRIFFFFFPYRFTNTPKHAGAPTPNTISTDKWIINDYRRREMRNKPFLASRKSISPTGFRSRSNKIIPGAIVRELRCRSWPRNFIFPSKNASMSTFAARALGLQFGPLFQFPYTRLGFHLLWYVEYFNLIIFTRRSVWFQCVSTWS